MEFSILQLDRGGLPVRSPQMLPVKDEVEAHRAASRLISLTKQTVEVWRGTSLVWRLQPRDAALLGV